MTDTTDTNRRLSNMTTRLYLDFASSDKTIMLPAEECHYLLRVLRLKAGDVIHIYNERAGEWCAELVDVTKTVCSAALQEQVRAATPEPITRLVYAPLKHDAMSFLYEKATELGVTHLQPMVTDFAQKYTVHAEKVMRQLKQASQQCERLSVPVLLPPMAFSEVLQGVRSDGAGNERSGGEGAGSEWRGSEGGCSERGAAQGCGDLVYGDIYIALERADAHSFAELLSQQPCMAPCTFVIGPEGGFSSREVDLVKAQCGMREGKLSACQAGVQTTGMRGIMTGVVTDSKPDAVADIMAAVMADVKADSQAGIMPDRRLSVHSGGVTAIHCVSLGRSILRAETAAIVGMGAISMWRG